MKGIMHHEDEESFTLAGEPTYDLGDMKLTINPIGSTLVISNPFTRVTTLGLGLGEEREVVDYDPKSNVVTLDRPFSPEYADPEALVMVSFKDLKSVFVPPKLKPLKISWRQRLTNWLNKREA